MTWYFNWKKYVRKCPNCDAPLVKLYNFYTKTVTFKCANCSHEENFNAIYSCKVCDIGRLKFIGEQQSRIDEDITEFVYKCDVCNRTYSYEEPLEEY